MNSITRNPIAFTFFILYMMMWAIVALQLIGMAGLTTTDHGSFTGMFPMLVFMLTGPYLIVTLGLALLKATDNKFYWKLLGLELIPVVIVMVVVSQEL